MNGERFFPENLADLGLEPKDISHAEVIDRFAPYVAHDLDDLDVQSQVDLIHHLRTCSICREMLEALELYLWARSKVMNQPTGAETISPPPVLDRRARAAAILQRLGPDGFPEECQEEAIEALLKRPEGEEDLTDEELEAWLFRWLRVELLS